jgi:hypothetical protein
MHEALLTLLPMLEVLRPALTRPGFENLRVLFCGWVLTPGAHAVTEALVQTRVAGQRHHEAFHRFFSRGTWCPDELGRLLFQFIVQVMPAGSPLRLALDDTLAPKKGAHVFGIGSHLDAVRSTKRQKIFSFGHCWVVLALVMPVPFSTRTWALPILFRLYRTQKECAVKKGQPHRKKTQLGRDMLEVITGWVEGRRVELSADSAYCNDTITRGLASNIILFGAMRPDAVLTRVPASRRRHSNGRPRVRGTVLPKPAAMAKGRSPWLTTYAFLYGKRRTVEYKKCVAQWYRACGVRPLHVIVVRAAVGDIGIRVFFCTDPTLSVREILEGYAQRWAIEVCFRELKQLLGFADSSARKQAAVERTAPFVGLTYTMLVLWAVKGAHSVISPPLRPWYSHKRGLSFADILRTAQRTLASVDLLDPPRASNNLQKARRMTRSPSRRRLKRVA